MMGQAHVRPRLILLESFQSEAACQRLGIDPEIFFEPWSEDYAVMVCHGCPVRAACLMAGMREEYGVWGGMTARGRARLKRRVARSPGRAVD